MANLFPNGIGYNNSSSTSDRDEAFRQSGLSEDFRDQFNASWDAYEPSQISDTWLDSFMSFLGLRSSSDVARLELEQKRKDAIAQLVGLQREQEYNSESATVSRMRAAGLNPDLQGLGQGSEASEFTEPEQRVDFSGLDTGPKIAGFFSTALKDSLGIFGSVLGLKSAGIDIANKEISSLFSNVDGLSGFAKSIMTTPVFQDIINSTGDDIDVYQRVANLVNDRDFWSEMFSDFGIKSKRAKRQLISTFTRYINSLRGSSDSYSNLSDYIESQDKYSSSLANPFREQGFDTPISDITSALREYNKLFIELDKEQAKYEKKYYSLLKAKSIASAQNASSEWQSYCMKKKKELYQKLVGKNDTFSQILASQLMGNIDFFGNSGISGLAKTASKFINPVRKFQRVP